jgi:Protein of unknown function (DUF3592)
MATPVLIPTLALAVSTLMTLRAWGTFVLGRASLRWTRVEGMVVGLHFDESMLDNQEGEDDVTFSAHLTYAYTVRGRRYRSERFTYRPTRGLGQRQAYAMLQGMHRGQAVDVYHDPQRPERAVVLQGVDNGNIVEVCFWGAVAVASLWWLFAV